MIASISGEKATLREYRIDANVLGCDVMSANQANTSGQLTVRPGVKFNGVKVFSATMVADREQLGEKVSAWMTSHTQHKLTDIVVTQSSDEAFHCIAITVFYLEDVVRS